MSVAFLLTTLVIVATPGTGVIYTLSAGLSRGTRASLVAAFGCTLGIVPHVVAAMTGLAAVLNASAVAFQTLKAWESRTCCTWRCGCRRDRSEIVVRGQTEPLSAGRVIWSAVLLNVLNPKLTIFFFAFLPQFVHPDEPGALLHMTALSGVFMAMTFVVFAVYGAFAAAVRSQVVSRPRVVLWMRRTFAGAFVALGAKRPDRPVTGYAPMPLRLETERLVLTPEVESDAPWFAGALTTRGIGTFTVDDARERIAAMAVVVDTLGIGALVLRRRDDDEALGYCQAIVVGRGTVDEPEIAYELLPSAHGHGYATEAARAVLDAAFATGRTRIWSTVRPWNAPSLRVLDKLGFRRDHVTVDDAGEIVWLVRERV